MSPVFPGVGTSHAAHTPHPWSSIKLLPTKFIEACLNGYLSPASPPTGHLDTSEDIEVPLDVSFHQGAGVFTRMAPLPPPGWGYRYTHRASVNTVPFEHVLSEHYAI